MDFGDAAPLSTIEFGSLDEEVFTRFDDAVEGVPVAGPAASRQADDGFHGDVDPWRGPDVEFVFDADADPFQEFFEQEERIVDRFLVRSGDGFGGQPRVSSREGEAIVRELMELEGDRPAVGWPAGGAAATPAAPAPVATTVPARPPRRRPAARRPRETRRPRRATMPTWS
jgi:hypothetical protein